MKKLLILIVLAALGYGIYYFMMNIQKATEQRQGDWNSEKKMEKVENEGTK